MHQSLAKAKIGQRIEHSNDQADKRDDSEILGREDLTDRGE